ALLADLLEEARRGRATQDGVEQRGGEPAPVGAGDADAADADVVLLGVLAQEADAGRRRLDERLPDARARLGRLDALVRRTLEQAEQLVVVEVAGGGEHDVPGRVHMAVIGRQRAL